MSKSYRTRRIIALLILLLLMAIPLSRTDTTPLLAPEDQSKPTQTTIAALDALAIKGRAPKTGYSRDKFGNGWENTFGCDTRNIILRRDMQNVRMNAECKVLSGTLNDPYTGKSIAFVRGETSSDDVQIDHVVALSNAWQTGAQQHSSSTRVAFANDALNLLAVDGRANEQKSDGDSATWLPPNKLFRCQYVSRQIAVKSKYSLWVTTPERQAMLQVLQTCT